MKLKLVAVAVAALVPVVALLAYNEVAVRFERNEEVRAAAAQAARQASSEVERIIEGLHSLLISVSSMPSVQNLDVSACSEALSSVASKVGNIRTIFVVDPRGQAICGSMKTPGQNFSDRNYFKRVLETKNFVVGTYTKSRMSDAAVLPVALPVLEGDTVKAVVVTGVRLEWLQTRIAERGVAPRNAVTIADLLSIRPDQASLRSGARTGTRPIPIATGLSPRGSTRWPAHTTFFSPRTPRRPQFARSSAALWPPMPGSAPRASGSDGPEVALVLELDCRCRW